MANYSDLRTIPRKINIVGERTAGVDYIGCANSQLKILEHELSLGTVQDGYRTTRIGDSVIEAWKFGNQSGAKITVLGGEKEGSKELLECFCNCSFTQGYILNPTKDTPDYPSENRRYDVLTCKTKTSYTMYQGCLPSDHINYETEAMGYGKNSVNGMPVILFLDNKRPVGDPWKCSSPGDVRSVYNTGCEGATRRGDDFPIYRIIPIFSFFRKWYTPDSGEILNARGRVANVR